MGSIDLPTMIDYVLDFTGLPDLYYVGFSMGTTTFFAMMSERPEYKEKVRQPNQGALLLDLIWQLQLLA